MIIRRRNKVIGQISGRTLIKKIKEDKHLFWRFGGVPALDAFEYDAHKGEIDEISITTDRGKIFTSSKENFEQKKKEINFGNYGRQYTMELAYWNIL